MSSYDLLDDNITPSCEEEFDQIGVDERLILVNWDNYNREETQSNDNKIYIETLESQFYIDTKKNSISPDISSSKVSNDRTFYSHNLSFVILSKTNETRNTLEKLANGKFIAILLDKSTGKYELFGEDCGLVTTSISRSSTGSTTSNGYSISMSQSSNNGGKESRLPRLFNQTTNDELYSVLDFGLDMGLH